MNIIHSHDITLYGGTDEYDMILRPLTDEHLLILYEWHTDPDLYWAEKGDVNIECTCNAKTVDIVWNQVSQTFLCSLIEVNGNPVGLCNISKKEIWPDDVNPESIDIRHIEVITPEKELWRQDIGTAVIRMVVDYAFSGAYVDALYYNNFDYDSHAPQVWENNGFSSTMSLELPSPLKGTYKCIFQLTREEYIQQHRTIVPPDKIFELPLTKLQPSQLYVSDGKLRLAQTWFDPSDQTHFDPIPIKLYNDNYLMTDGHTRAILAVRAGWKSVPVTWDNDPLDMVVNDFNVN